MLTLACAPGTPETRPPDDPSPGFEARLTELAEPLVDASGVPEKAVGLVVAVRSPQVNAVVGALHSTVKDLLTFLAPAVGDGPADAVQAWKAVEEPRRPQPDLTAASIGLMLVVSDEQPVRRYLKAGGTAGFTSIIAFTTSPQAIVVVLANAKDARGVPALAQQVLDEVLALQ